MDNGERDEKLVESIVTMARALDLEVIAEGIEKEEHLEFLKRIDCHIVQGYFTGKPLSLENLMNLIETGEIQLIQEI